MSDMSKVLKGVVVLGVAAGLGTLIGWLVSRQGDVKPILVSSSDTATPAAAPQAVQSSQAPAQNQQAFEAMPRPKRTVNDFAEHPSDWEASLDDILLGSDDENSKADKILALIPNAPPEAKQELAQHLVNMVQDDHYDGTAQMLTNSSTPVEVSDVLMNDLLNRNNNLKLPMLLSIARNDTHPLKDQALDLLGLLTQEDNGTNWDQWSTSIDTWLQNNQ
jgi:hypothetical protein